MENERDTWIDPPAPKFSYLSFWTPRRVTCLLCDELICTYGYDLPDQLADRAALVRFAVYDSVEVKAAHDRHRISCNENTRPNDAARIRDEFLKVFEEGLPA